MAARYIPPALRNATRQATTAPESNFTSPHSPLGHAADEIDAYFWPADSEVRHDAYVAASKTLHDSAKNPGKLAYVLLFDGANPRWESDRIVFAKSSLELLPAPVAAIDEGKYPSQAPTFGETPLEPTGADSSKTSALDQSNPFIVSAHIAVFKQMYKQRGTSSGFVFEGWFDIAKVDFLEPKSPDLIRMLEQKWSVIKSDGNVIRLERDEAAWKGSLNLRWAVVKFAPVIAEGSNMEPPAIQKIAGKGRSVNELLAALRQSAQPATAR